MIPFLISGLQLNHVSYLLLVARIIVMHVAGLVTIDVKTNSAFLLLLSLVVLLLLLLLLHDGWFAGSLTLQLQ